MTSGSTRGHLGMCTSRVYLLPPGLDHCHWTCPRQRKNGMGTINGHIFIIDGAHGMIPLPQNTISALNRISSEPGLLEIPCGPWHLGRARAWARAQGFRSGPGTGPGKPWARAQAWAQAWAWPKCHGPHGIFSSPGSELILFRAERVCWGSGSMPWASSMVKI